MLTFVPNKHIYGIAKIRNGNKIDNNNILSNTRNYGNQRAENPH